MASKEPGQSGWSSTQGFVLAATGVAIGFSNFWGFPSLLVEHGGSAFLLLYFIALILIGLPLLMCEVMLGRRGRQGMMNSLRTLAIASGSRETWKYLGVVGIITAVLILSYYSVIYGWALGYFFRALSGKFTGQTAQGVSSIFGSFVSDPEVLLAWHTLFMAALIAVVSRGVRQGIEPVSRIMVLGIFVILICLAAYVSTADHASLVLAQLFAADFTKLTWQSVFEAMKYAFFSLTVGLGAYLVYGASVSRKTSIFVASAWIIVLDVIVAIMAVGIIFIILDIGQQEFVDGDKLLFLAIPLALGHVTGGVIWTSMFYLMLVFAAVSSGVALLEMAVTWAMEKFNIRRLRAAITVGMVIWGIGILTALSFHQQSPLRFVFRYAGTKREFGLFNVIEVIAGNILMPLLAMGLLIFSIRGLSSDAMRDEFNMRDGIVYTIWRKIIGIVAPVLIFLVFLYCNGKIVLK